MLILILFNSDSAGMDRLRLDRRRLEEAHMRFCILDVFKQYPHTFPTWNISTSLQQSLDHIIPHYFNAFSAKYAGQLTYHSRLFSCEYNAQQRGRRRGGFTPPLFKQGTMDSLIQRMLKKIISIFTFARFSGRGHQSLH